MSERRLAMGGTGRGESGGGGYEEEMSGRGRYINKEYE
jgi:hypothetical protein